MAETLSGKLAEAGNAISETATKVKNRVAEKADEASNWVKEKATQVQNRVDEAKEKSDNAKAAAQADAKS